jgi:hypothetical protein
LADDARLQRLCLRRKLPPLKIPPSRIANEASVINTPILVVRATHVPLISTLTNRSLKFTTRQWEACRVHKFATQTPSSLAICHGAEIPFGCSRPTVEAAFGKRRLSATFELLVVETVGLSDGTPLHPTGSGAGVIAA